MVWSPRLPCGGHTGSRNHTPIPSQNRHKYTGIDGSDLYEHLGGPIFIPVEKERPCSGRKASPILGYEFAGGIVEVGADVHNIKVGDRVTVEPIWAEEGLKGKVNTTSAKTSGSSAWLPTAVLPNIAWRTANCATN